MVIWLIFAILIAAAFGNGITYFILMNEAGSLVTGILLIAKSILVFLVSAFLFCDQHIEQCFSGWKALSSFVIVAGVSMFVVASPAPESTVSVPRSSHTDESDHKNQPLYSASASLVSLDEHHHHHSHHNDRTTKDDDSDDSDDGGSSYDLE